MGLVTGIAAHRWPGNCAPYAYNRTRLTPTEIANIESAVQLINATGAARLIPRTTHSRYIDVVPDYQPLDGVCWSSAIGMSGGRQEVRLDPNTRVGVIVHEFLHALGVSHEQKRPDRQGFVIVDESKVMLTRQGDFMIAHAPGAVPVGTYDLDSVMHYGPSPRASVDGRTPIITTLDPTNQSRIGQRRGLSAGDLASLQALDRGSVLVVGLDTNGQMGGLIGTADWVPGFNLVSAYQVMGATFLFALKTSDGRVWIHDVAASGAIGALRDARDWTSGWTTALPYSRGPQACLLLYKAGSGLLRLHALTSAGTVGGLFEESTNAFGGGWTSIAHYTIGASDYLFFLREATGEMQVHGVGWNGGLGQRVQLADWSSGWTTACPFTTSHGGFLFLLKAATGQMHINAIQLDGHIGPRVPTVNWTPGWTVVRPFVAGSHTFLFSLQSASGDARIHRLNANGTLGGLTDTRRFAPGFRSAAVIQRGGNAALVLVKS